MNGANLPRRTALAAWPTRPLELLVGFRAGSEPDLMARLPTEPLARAPGEPVVVDNRPGASGNGAADLPGPRDGRGDRPASRGTGAAADNTATPSETRAGTTP